MKKTLAVFMLAFLALPVVYASDSTHRFMTAFPALNSFSSNAAQVMRWQTLCLLSLNPDQVRKLTELLEPVYVTGAKKINALSDGSPNWVEQWIEAGLKGDVPPIAQIDKSHEFTTKMAPVIEEYTLALRKISGEIEKLLDENQKSILKAEFGNQFTRFPFDIIQSVMTMTRAQLDREKVSISEKIIESVFSKNDVKKLGRGVILLLEKHHSEKDALAKNRINPYYWTMNQIIGLKSPLEESLSLKEAISQLFFSQDAFDSLALLK